MTTQTEAEAHAAQQIEAQMRVALEAAKPKLSLLHHLAAVQAIRPVGFTVMLVDGAAYRADSVDHVFTDGLSVVADDHRRYFSRDQGDHDPQSRRRELITRLAGRGRCTLAGLCPSSSIGASPPQPAWTRRWPT
jgi:hypothetical protein